MGRVSHRLKSNSDSGQGPREGKPSGAFGGSIRSTWPRDRLHRLLADRLSAYRFLYVGNREPYVYVKTLSGIPRTDPDSSVPKTGAARAPGELNLTTTGNPLRIRESKPAAFRSNRSHPDPGRWIPAS